MSKTFSTDITDHSSTHCQNCGWGSHCGGPRHAEVKNLGHTIEVCKHCRCNTCSPKEPLNSSK
ncbi:MAG: hypothetical protein ACKVJK_19335 [Methylophagaceae bacterium]